MVVNPSVTVEELGLRQSSCFYTKDTHDQWVGLLGLSPFPMGIFPINSIGFDDRKERPPQANLLPEEGQL